MPGKVKYNQLSDEEKKKYLGEFYDMVSLLDGRDEIKSFFKDLLTLSETVMISRRIQIAKMLLAGINYQEIKEELKVGNSTITYVDKWLNNGFDGYRKILERHGKNNENKKVGKYDFSYDPQSFESFRKKHPGHFLLLNMILDRKDK